MRCAAARVASRRGSSITIRPSSQSCSISQSGAIVVLPAPGGATSSAVPMVVQRRRQLRQHVDDRKIVGCCRQRHVSAECWRAVKRPGITSHWDGGTDPCRRRGDLLGDRAPLRSVPSLGACLRACHRAE